MKKIAFAAIDGGGEEVEPRLGQRAAEAAVLGGPSPKFAPRVRAKTVTAAASATSDERERRCPSAAPCQTS